MALAADAQEPEQVKGGGVRPLQIFEEQHERVLPGEGE